MPQTQPEAFNGLKDILFNLSPVGIYQLDPSAQFFFVNPEWTRITGMNLEQTQDKGWLSAVHPEDKENVFKKWTEFLTGLETFQDTYRFLKADGKIVWVFGVANRVQSEDGKLLGYHGSLLDITELKTAEIKLNGLFESMHEGYTLIDQSGKIVQFNKAALKILGLTESQLLGREARDPYWKAITTDGDDYPLDQHPSALAFATGRPQLGKIMGIFNSQNELRWVVVNARPLFLNNNDKPDQVICAFEDVTEQKRKEVQMLYTAKMSSLGEMAAGIAHEINNPLAIISGNAQLLHSLAERKSLSFETLQKYAKNIEQTATRISKIIKGLRSFARDADKDPFEQVSLATVVEETLAFCQAKFTYHEVELRVNVNKDLHLETRPAQLSQILLNLLSNAYDAIENQAEKWIQVEAIEDLEEIKIYIIDSGKGIPKDLKKKIMQPFFTTKEVGKGTGLGLSIINGLVQDHRGKFYIDETHANTCFVVCLPKNQTNQNLSKTA